MIKKQKDDIREEYKKKRPCAELCRYAADILEEKLIEKGLI